MRQRTDGIQTRRRILRAACEIFAANGFRDATVADICERAETNVASVNYHFRDKESLYIEVWRHVAQRAAELHPIGGGVPANAPVEERLRGHLHTLLQRMNDRGRLGDFQRLRMLEMANPTGFIDPIREELRQPYREHLRKVVRELLGPRATEKAVELCALSVMGQCRAARRRRGFKCRNAAASYTEAELEELAEHITKFSLAGIRAVRRGIQHDRRGLTASGKNGQRDDL